MYSVRQDRGIACSELLLFLLAANAIRRQRFASDQDGETSMLTSASLTNEVIEQLQTVRTTSTGALVRHCSIRSLAAVKMHASIRPSKWNLRKMFRN